MAVSDGTGISWCDATWPIVAGCTHVSPGCDGCWSAFHTSGRLRHRPEYAGLATGGRFTGQVRLLPERLTWPTRWTRKPRKVFVASAADLFHEAVPDAFIAAAWVVMYRTGQPTYGGRHRAPLVFQVLTKRHARMRSWVRKWADPASRVAMVDEAVRQGWCDQQAVREAPGMPAVLESVWLGVSVETQQWAATRIPALLETPAAIHWISAEPLLGPIDLRNLQARGAVIDVLAGDVKTTTGEIYAACPAPLDWVVIGGESGPKARPMHPDWARKLRDDTRACGRALWFKQWGEWAPTGKVGLGQPLPRHAFVGEAVDERGFRVEMQRLGKKAAGHTLDGHVHHQFPLDPDTR